MIWLMRVSFCFVVMFRPPFTSASYACVEQAHKNCVVFLSDVGCCGGQEERDGRSRGVGVVQGKIS